MIGLAGVTKRYGDRVVLDSLDLTLAPGAVTALTGPNGCGKTTVARLLLGLTTPDAGQVHLPSGTRRSAVFQEDRLCPGLTALANLRLVRAGRRAVPDLLDGLRAVGIDGATACGLPVRALSGGQRRRVAIARALAVDADLVVLDEPFTGLDVDGRATVLARVDEICAGRTVLLITHDLAEARSLDAEIIHLATPAP